jgi:hypothetical protein
MGIRAGIELTIQQLDSQLWALPAEISEKQEEMILYSEQNEHQNSSLSETPPAKTEVR